MTSKLVQTHLLKGRREFELDGDAVRVRIRSPFGKVTDFTVKLDDLDAEPVINRSCLEFHDRVEGQVQLSLYLAKPDSKSFNAFLAALKQAVAQTSNTSMVDLPAAATGAMGANEFEEPPGFEEPERASMAERAKRVNAERVDEAIQLLEQYLDADEIKPLLEALDALRSDPNNEVCLERVVKVFEELGPTQGAVLTYAPYVSLLMTDGSTW